MWRLPGNRSLADSCLCFSGYHRLALPPSVWWVPHCWLCDMGVHVGHFGDLPRLPLFQGGRFRSGWTSPTPPQLMHRDPHPSAHNARWGITEDLTSLSNGAGRASCPLSSSSSVPLDHTRTDQPACGRGRVPTGSKTPIAPSCGAPSPCFCD